MSKRDEFVARMKAHLDEWGEELHRLESQVGDAKADVSHKYRQTIAELREKQREAETKLEDVRHAGEEAWEEFKDEAERTWAAFKAGLDAIRDFSDHS